MRAQGWEGDDDDDDRPQLLPGLGPVPGLGPIPRK